MTSVLAVGVYPSLTYLRNLPAPESGRYATTLDRPGGFFRFLVGDLSVDDGWTAIVPTNQGGAWRWVPFADKGADLVDGPQTVDVTGGWWRSMPVATLTADAVVTLGVTAALEGMRLRLTRFDVGAHALSFLNAGPSAGTILTMPVSSRARIVAYFNSSGNWEVEDSHLMI